MKGRKRLFSNAAVGRTAALPRSASFEKVSNTGMKWDLTMQASYHTGRQALYDTQRGLSCKRPCFIYVHFSRFRSSFTILPSTTAKPPRAVCYLQMRCSHGLLRRILLTLLHVLHLLFLGCYRLLEAFKSRAGIRYIRHSNATKLF